MNFSLIYYIGDDPQEFYVIEGAWRFGTSLPSNRKALRRKMGAKAHERAHHD